MAGKIKGFFDSMRLNNDDDDDYEFEPDEDLNLDDYDNRKSKSRIQLSSSARDRDAEASILDLDDDPEDEEAPVGTATRRRLTSRKPASNVVPMRQSSKGSFEVCMVKPTSMNDAKELCDILISGRAVVINLEGVDSGLAQRVIDFASGACYSLKGNLQNINRNIFIVTPSHIGLTGDFNQNKFIKKDSTANMD